MPDRHVRERCEVVQRSGRCAPVRNYLYPIDITVYIVLIIANSSCSPARTCDLVDWFFPLFASTNLG